MKSFLEGTWKLEFTKFYLVSNKNIAWCSNYIFPELIYLLEKLAFLWGDCCWTSNLKLELWDWDLTDCLWLAEENLTFISWHSNQELKYV